MSNKKNALKYLSQSVLLEERGIPKLNLWIILIVFFMTVGFVIWSMTLQLDETIKLKGQVVENSSMGSTYAFKATVPSEDVGLVKEGTQLTITIPGISTMTTLNGTIQSIEERYASTELSSVYFEAFILPDSAEGYKQIDGKLRKGMKANFQTIIGHKTLFEYFLGSIIKTKDNALTEN